MLPIIEISFSLMSVPILNDYFSFPILNDYFSFKNNNGVIPKKKKSIQNPFNISYMIYGLIY